MLFLLWAGFFFFFSRFFREFAEPFGLRYNEIMPGTAKPVTPPAVRAYMAEIGRRGGKSGKGTKWRKEVCRHAAVMRWRQHRAKMRELDKREEQVKAYEQNKAVMDMEDALRNNTF